MGSPTKEWSKLPSPGLMFFRNSTEEVRQTETTNNSVRKVDDSIMYMGNTIIAAAAEAGIGENWCLLDNQSICNAFINKKYLSNVRDAPNGQHICFHCKSGVKNTNKNFDLPRYSDPVWYNPKRISKILSLGLVH